MFYRSPRPITASDYVDDFECQSSEQTAWLIRHAKQSVAANITKVFVVIDDDSGTVVAYYAWTMAQLSLADAPKRLMKGAGRYAQPVALLARLGVHKDHERRGIGAGMLRDAIVRLVLVGEQIGCRGLLIHAESTEAREFYLHLVPELVESPTDSLHLVLMLKDAEQSLRRSS